LTQVLGGGGLKKATTCEEQQQYVSSKVSETSQKASQARFFPTVGAGKWLDLMCIFFFFKAVKVKLLCKFSMSTD